MPATTQVPFIDARSGRAVRALAEATTLVTSAGLGWRGLHVELGHNGPWRVEDLSVADHYLAINVAQSPLHFQTKSRNSSKEVTLESGAAWFCPGGESFSHDVRMDCDYALVTLSPARLGELVGVEVAPGRLGRAYGLKLGQLEHLVRALVEEARLGGPSGRPFADAVATALASKIVENFGQARASSAEAQRGALPAARLRSVKELVASRLDDELSVEEMAREAGLSPAHFARAFKKATGEAPHRFVLNRKLEKARDALERGLARELGLAALATQWGFFDQAHFTRKFRERYGVTPGAFARGVRG